MIEDLNDLYVFLKQWYQDIPTPLGLDAAVIPDFVPDILRDFYVNVGALTKPFPEIAKYSDQNLIPLAQQDSITPPDELQIAEDGFITFGWENQGNWAVAVKQGSGNDIYFKGDTGENWDSFENFVKSPSTLIDFLITQSLAETTLVPASWWFNLSEDGEDALRAETPILLWKTSYPPFDMMEVNDYERRYYISEKGDAIRFLDPEFGARKSWIGRPTQSEPIEMIKPIRNIFTNLFGRR